MIHHTLWICSIHDQSIKIIATEKANYSAATHNSTIKNAQTNTKYLHLPSGQEAQPYDSYEYVCNTLTSHACSVKSIAIELHECNII